MGSIRRAPRTNRWEARYRDPTGRQRTATFARKGDAVAFLAVTETVKRRGEWLEPEASRITLRQWHDRWWPTVENSDRAANTLVQYESISGCTSCRTSATAGWRRCIGSTLRNGWRR